MLTFSKFNEQFSAKYHKKLNTLCQPLFSALGVNSFFYQALDNKDNFFSFCTDPELMDFYFVEHQMYQHNPFITQFSQLKSGIYFQEKVFDETFQNTEKSLQDKFGIKYCCLMTRKLDNICHEFGFGRPPEKSEIDLLIVNNLGFIQAFIPYFEREMHSVIKEMHHQPVNIKNTKKRKEILPSLNCDRSKKTRFSQTDCT